MEPLFLACEWVSTGESLGVEAEAFVARADGRICLRGDGEEECPDDVEDVYAYVAVPTARALGMDRRAVFRFAEERAPELLYEIEQIFRRKGAYERLEALLSRTGKREEWNAYREAAQRAALEWWCAENGFEAVQCSV